MSIEPQSYFKMYSLSQIHSYVLYFMYNCVSRKGTFLNINLLKKKTFLYAKEKKGIYYETDHLFIIGIIKAVLGWGEIKTRESL